MTPQSKFVKDECCRLIRKGVFMRPHLLAMKKFRVCIIGVILESSFVGCRSSSSFVVRVEVRDGDRRRTKTSRSATSYESRG